MQSNNNPPLFIPYKRIVRLTPVDGGAVLRIPGVVTTTPSWNLILRRDPCSYCGGTGGTVDHIRPCHHHGCKDDSASVWSNKTGACECCNGKKGNRPFSLLMLCAMRTTGGAVLPSGTSECAGNS